MHYLTKTRRVLISKISTQYRSEKDQFFRFCLSVGRPGEEVHYELCYSMESSSEQLLFSILISLDPAAICDRLINQLEAQAAEAETLSKDHREAGLINLADKFFDLADVSRKWISLTTAYRNRSRVPQYAFEKANLSRLNINTDLGDGVLEVTVVRGISLPVPPGVSGPSALDTYVSLELPFPSSESPQKHSTEWARHTNEPTDYGGYQASARFEVNRKAKSYERLLQGIKSLKATVSQARLWQNMFDFFDRLIKFMFYGSGLL